jgi:predicted DNA-binding antitoxin AbrB/MazE fold protein
MVGNRLEFRRPHMADEQENPSIRLHGVVDKIVRSVDPTEPEKAQIVIEEAEHLYKEIRIDNALQDGDGAKVKLKQGTEVDVTIEAPHDGVDKRKEGDEKKSA